MGFESVRAYVQLASGLSDLTRARATEAAQGLLTLPAASLATGTKMASQASALADELLAAAAANRSNLQALVRSEVDVAITRLGLVPVQQLEEAQAEAAKLRQEVAALRSASSKAAPKGTARKAAPAPKSPPKKATATRRPAKKSGTAARSAVTTHVKPAGT
jgi:BMFP domain-containing protein YqiC